MDDPALFLSVTDRNPEDGSVQFELDGSASQQRRPLSQAQTPMLPLKVRSSCDACGQAKVKCDRGQPTCARCVAQGVNCVYSASRKGGKPPRRWAAASSPLSSRSSEPKTASIDLSGGGGHDDIDMMLSLADGALAFDYPFFASDAAFQTRFPFESLGSLGALTPISSDQDTWMSGQNDSGLKPGESSTATNAAAVAVARPCCTGESKDIMRWLYCANPSAPVSEGVPARTLDLGSVLTRNRDVVRRLGLLLRCPCARSPHMAMLYASIVSRVLLWYRQAVWNATPAGVSSLSSLSSLSSFSPTLTAQETMASQSSSATLKTFDTGAVDDNSGVSVLPMPVMVGTFQSDDRNLQTALTNCLILSELRRVGSFIDSFISLGTGTSDIQTVGDACPAAGEFSTSRADASLFASIGSWLRTEHGRIVRRARSGLSVLDENLSF